MFDWLLNFFANLWSAFVSLVQGVWDFCKTGWTWIVALIVGFVSVTHHVSTFVYNTAADLLTQVSGVALTSSPGAHVGTAGDIIAIANTFFPVAEGFTLVVAYCLIVAAAYSYRLVKSWLPTLS